MAPNNEPALGLSGTRPHSLVPRQGGNSGCPPNFPNRTGVVGRREVISWQGDLGEDGPLRLPLSRAGPSYRCGVIIRDVARRFPERTECHPENYLNSGGRTTRCKMASCRSRGLGARHEIVNRGLSVNFQVPSGGIQDAVSAARLPLSSDRRFVGVVQEAPCEGVWLSVHYRRGTYNYRG